MRRLVGAHGNVYVDTFDRRRSAGRTATEPVEQRWLLGLPHPTGAPVPATVTASVTDPAGTAQGFEWTSASREENLGDIGLIALNETHAVFSIRIERAKRA